MTDSTPAAPAVKPGYKTTEFWLSLAAVVLGALLASGIFADGSTPLRIAGLAASVLGALGYTGARASIKNAAPMLAMLLGVGLVLGNAGCGANAASQRETTIKAAVITAKATVVGFASWDLYHQHELEASATSREDAQAKVTAYRLRRNDVIEAERDLLDLLHDAWLLKTAPSIAAAVTAATKLQALIAAIEAVTK